jgi:hypothetical protein
MERGVNIQVSDMAPKDYMEIVTSQANGRDLKIGRIDDPKVLAKNLRQNCIPKGFENMTAADYPKFLETRRKLMATKLEKYYKSL